MAYATIEQEGRIQVYGVLPYSYHSEYGNVLGGFNRLPDDELEKHGFYPVEELVLTDTLFQKKGEIYFDEASKVFKYHTEQQTHPEVEELKKQKLDSLEWEKKSLLQQTNDDVIEALELGEPIPTEISASRSRIRTQAIKLKAEIDILITQRDLLTYTGSIII